MSEDDDEWPPERYGYSLSAPYKRDRAHDGDWGPYDLSVESLLRILAPGDRILWGDRKRPLTVQSLDHRAGSYINDGYWEAGATWEVEGERGATYCVANWMHRIEDDAVTQVGDREHHRCYPQVYRTTDGSWSSEGKLDHVVVVDDGHWHTDSRFKRDDPVETVVFDWAERGLSWGSFEDIEFGDPVVSVETDDGPMPVAVERDWVVAYRTEVSAT